jgi:hypothetical protein
MLLCYVDFAHRLVSLNNLTKKTILQNTLRFGKGLPFFFFITHFPFAVICGDIVLLSAILIDSDK